MHEQHGIQGEEADRRVAHRQLQGQQRSDRVDALRMALTRRFHCRARSRGEHFSDLKWYTSTGYK